MKTFLIIVNAIICLGGIRTIWLWATYKAQGLRRAELKGKFDRNVIKLQEAAKINGWITVLYLAIAGGLTYYIRTQL